MSETEVWRMGKWRVMCRNNGYVVVKLNQLGRVIWSGKPHTGWQSRKNAITEGKMKYASEAEE